MCSAEALLARTFQAKFNGCNNQCKFVNYQFVLVLPRCLWFGLALAGQLATVNQQHRCRSGISTAFSILITAAHADIFDQTREVADIRRMFQII